MTIPRDCVAQGCSTLEKGNRANRRQSKASGPAWPGSLGYRSLSCDNRKLSGFRAACACAGRRTSSAHLLIAEHGLRGTQPGHARSHTARPTAGLMVPLAQSAAHGSRLHRKTKCLSLSRKCNARSDLIGPRATRRAGLLPCWGKRPGCSPIYSWIEYPVPTSWEDGPENPGNCGPYSLTWLGSQVSHPIQCCPPTPIPIRRAKQLLCPKSTPTCSKALPADTP